MALNTLTLSTTQGQQGRPFSATISGLTSGSRLDIGGDGAPGFYTVNGKVYSQALPYPTSTLVLRETLPGTGVNETRIDIIAQAAFAGASSVIGSGSLIVGSSAGTVIAALSDPYAGQGYGTTTYTDVSGDAQLAISGSNLVVGSSAAVAGTVYSKYVRANRGDGKADIGSTLSFTAVAGSVVAPTLGALTLSSTAFSTGGQTSVGINGKTAGSTITATSSDGTALTVSGSTLTGTFTTAGSPTISLVETLSGATGSPKTSAVACTVASAATSVLAADRLFQPFSGQSQFSGAPSATASATSATMRIRHVVPQDVMAAMRAAGITSYTPKATFVGWSGRNASNSPVETNVAGPLTVGVSYEYNTNTALTNWAPGSGTNVVVADTFGGASTGTCAAGGQLRADGVAAIPVPASGALVFYEINYVAASGGWPIGTTLLPGGQNYDQIIVGSDARGSVRASTWTNTSIAVFAAVTITQELPTSASVAPVLVIGDSIPTGTGYNPSDSSYMDLADGITIGTATTAGENHGMLKITEPGEQASQFINGGSAKRLALLSGLRFSQAFVTYGTNDLANGRTYAQLAADYGTLLTLVNNTLPGLPVKLVTLLPRKQTDGVTDPTTAYKADRNSFNALLYTLVGTKNVSKVIDIASLLENAPASQAGNGDNSWKDAKFTIDYIHPSGGTASSGTSGTKGTTAAGGGHATLATLLQSEFQ